MDEPARFREWLRDSESRHLADLRVAEVARALRAVSSAYVERRGHAIAGGRVLDGTGKRAAFALYYAPLHYLLIRHIAGALAIEPPAGGVVVDLGCGTGVAAAALMAEDSTSTSPTSPNRPTLLAIDSHPWAVGETRLTCRAFALDATVKRGDITRARLPRHTALVVAAFVVNELDAGARDALLPRLLAAPHALVVEPISTRVSPWWPQWVDAFDRAGGRADEWKAAIAAPPIVATLGDAAGLTTTSVSGRSLWR